MHFGYFFCGFILKSPPPPFFSFAESLHSPLTRRLLAESQPAGGGGEKYLSFGLELIPHFLVVRPLSQSNLGYLGSKW
jgi:hypothetical protein